MRRTEGRAASLPLVPGQIYSDCHVIVPVRWQCMRLDCVCLVDIAEACWEAVNEARAAALLCHLAERAFVIV